MRLAQPTDKHKVVDIIVTTFSQNPGVNWLLKKQGNHTKKLKRLAEFVFIKALKREGVFLSSNEKGVAICYQFNKMSFSLSEIYHELRFVITSVSLFRLHKVLKSESYRKKSRPGDGNYLYFWFLGVMDGGEKAVFELRDGIFKLAEEKGLPIYLETAVERNKVAYERYGFETYHIWTDEKEDIKFWFMRWNPSSD